MADSKTNSFTLNSGLIGSLLVVGFCTALGALVFKNTLTLTSIESKLDTQVAIAALKEADNEEDRQLNEQRWRSVWPRLRMLEHKVGIFTETDRPTDDL